MASSSASATQDTRTLTVAKYTAISSLTGGLVTAAYQATWGRTRALRSLQTTSPSNSLAAGPSHVSENTSASSGGNTLPLNHQNGSAARYRHPTALLSASAALNSGIVAFCFFNIREYMISPTLIAVRDSRLGEYTNEERHRQLTWSSMHTHNLFDSALTGALMGGAYRTFTAGLSKLVSGATTASLACTALQLFVNELLVLRVRLIAARHKDGYDANSELQFKSSETEFPASQSFLEAGSNAEQKSLFERTLGIFGLKKIDDDEYLRRLKAKRETHLARIRELEAQLQQEANSSGEAGAIERKDDIN